MSTTHVSPNFSWQEVECHDGEPTPPHALPNARRLATEVLEKIRAKWAGPVVVISWYRNPRYNAKVGGAKASQHLTGGAADIAPIDRTDVPGFASMVEQMIKDGELPGLGGFGVYKGWIHVDVRRRRADGTIARWSGAGVGSEMA